MSGSEDGSRSRSRSPSRSTNGSAGSRSRSRSSSAGSRSRSRSGSPPGLEDGEIADNLSALDEFYASKKRPDKLEVTLPLQMRTLEMYFESIVADGRMSAEAAKDFKEKYHVSDSIYERLAAPGLGSTKLFSVENRDFSGFYIRLLSLHNDFRGSLKFILKAYEMIASTSHIAKFDRKDVFGPDGVSVSPAFAVASLEQYMSELDISTVQAPQEQADVERLARYEQASANRMSHMESVINSLRSELHRANKLVEQSGKFHSGLDEILWAGLTRLGQQDIKIKEAREQDIKVYLSEGMKSALKSENKSRRSRAERHKSDKLLSKDVDKLVKQESSTKSNINKVIRQPKSGRGGGGHRQDSPPSKKPRYSGGSGGAYGGGGGKKKSFQPRKGPGSQNKKPYHSKEKGRGGGGGYSSSSKPKDRSGEPLLLTSFLWCWKAGIFSALALSSVSAAGLDMQTAVTVASLPIAGRVSKCINNWLVVSGSSWIHNVVRHGYKLLYSNELPRTPVRIRNLPTDAAAASVLDGEVEAMLAKQAVVAVQSSDNEIVSCFFARPKKQPGKWRPIVSLKYLNTFLKPIKFRMATIKDVKSWLRPGYYCCSIDLSDAYFTVGLHKSARKYVRFQWREILYEFCCIMFGLGPSARVFTKVVNAAVTFLRIRFSILVIAYLDDFIIQAATYEQCRLQTEIVILVLQCLGFGVNFSKSNLVPTRVIEHLGFSFDTINMTISVPRDKAEKYRVIVAETIAGGGCSADQLRSLVGKLESLKHAVPIAPLHFRALQASFRPLLRGRWRGKKFVPLNSASRADLEWWMAALLPAGPLSAPLRRGLATVEIMADASGTHGWGGHSSLGGFCQDSWSDTELLAHINRKEIWAGHRSIQELARPGDLIDLRLDNYNAVCYINKMGGTRSRKLCSDAISLWETVLSKGCWVSARWTPRLENQMSDLLSKERIDVWEFSLSAATADRIWSSFYTPSVDMFASRENRLLDRYYSLRPDSRAEGPDSLSVNRWPDRCYCFPPVPIIMSVVRKIQQCGISAILVVPEWRSSLWWDQVEEMLVAPPLVLGPSSRILVSSSGERLPYLYPLVACSVKGGTRPSRVC